jgi:hypothetical protein
MDAWVARFDAVPGLQVDEPVSSTRRKTHQTSYLWIPYWSRIGTSFRCCEQPNTRQGEYPFA